MKIKVRDESQETNIKVNNRFCKVCSRYFKYDKGIVNFADNNSCQECQFWAGKYAIRNQSNVARINNKHYIIGSEDDLIKGMGGQEYVIKFNNGRTVLTHNLWHQGDIPEVWRGVLFNNAEFIGS